MFFDIDIWQEIISTLKRNRLRSFLTAFGVFWGIFMLIIMLGVGTGLENGTTQEFKDLATNSVFLWTNATTKPYKGFPRGRRFYFDTEDITALRNSINEIEHLAPRNQLGGHRAATPVLRKQKDGAFNVYGDYPDIFNIMLMEMTSGRFINTLDLAQNRKVAVIGTRVYELLFEPGEQPIGKYIEIKGIYFKVIGVFKTFSTGDDAESRSQTIYVPFTTFSRAFNYGNFVSWFSITSQKNVPVSIVEKKAISLLAARHSIAPDDVHAFGHWNAEKEYKKLTGLFVGVNTLIWFVGICSLIAGVIGVTNIMLVIVKERTREIGIKRAIGATPASIVRQILFESVLLTSLAGYFGLVAGVGILEAVSELIGKGNTDKSLFLNPGVDLNIALTALTVLILSGLIAGLIPAKRAVDIKPMDAIRNV